MMLVFVFSNDEIAKWTMGSEEMSLKPVVEEKCCFYHHRQQVALAITKLASVRCREDSRMERVSQHWITTCTEPRDSETARRHSSTPDRVHSTTRGQPAFRTVRVVSGILPEPSTFHVKRAPNPAP